jgi:membrane dipeptidase
MPIFDGHNDTLLSVYLPERGGGRSFLKRSDNGHLDLPRAREGGFGGGLFAVFVPENPDVAEARDSSEEIPDLPFLPAPVDHPYALRTAISITAGLYRMEAESEGQVKVVRTADELTDCLQQGILAAVLHFEGAEPIDPALDGLQVFYEAGLRSLGIVWSRPNAFGNGVAFDFPNSPNTGPGLTPAGKDLVRTCNQLGIAIDLSHLNEKGFWDVVKLTDSPLIASHSCAHAVCPSTRNLTDKQLDAIGESGGVVGINFYVGFLRADGKRESDTPISDIVRHIDYIAERIGVEHVGFGSDFDGALIPNEVGDVTGLPKVVAALRDHGYDDAALRKITHENWIRVLKQTWK